MFAPDENLCATASRSALTTHHCCYFSSTVVVDAGQHERRQEEEEGAGSSVNQILQEDTRILDSRCTALSTV